VELGHHLSPHQRAGDLAVPLPGNRRLGRKVVAGDVDERKGPAIAEDLVSRACLRERISKTRKQPLILHADNGNSITATILESRLEELGVLRSFSRPRVSNDNPYSESLFRPVKYRPDYPRKPFTSKEVACQWVASFVDWYNHPPRHSGSKFVTPQQRPCGQVVEISRHRAVVYEQARQRHPGGGHDQRGAGVNRMWSGSISRRISSVIQGSYHLRKPPGRQPRSDTFPEVTVAAYIKQQREIKRKCVDQQVI
jgi:hypothetical protein